MASSSYKYVCVGGGNAAGYLAKELVADGLQAGELCIITEEQVVSYERPALSKAYLFPEGAARLPGFHTCVGGGGERQEPSWYTQHGITFLTGSRVVAADLAAKSLTLASGDTVSWQKLVIATGAEAVRLSDFGTPGADLGGVHYLRNVADGDSLLARLAAAKAAGGKVVVVGGGYIGLEVAAALCLHAGLSITMAFPGDRLMARLFTPELAGFYEAFYAAKGIKLVKGVLAKELKGNEAGQVTSVKLSDGSSLPADLVVVGTGARPASSLFKGQLDMDKPGGIIVDGNFQTSVPDVWAIGDVASFPLLCAGGATVRQEHVTHARSSAAQAAKALLGANPAPYDYTPYFYSREFNLSWQFYGLVDAPDSIVTWGDLSPAAAVAAAAAAQGQAAPKFGAYFIKGGKVVGAFVEGPSAEESAALRVVVRAAPPAPDAAVLQAEGGAWAVAASSKL